MKIAVTWEDGKIFQHFGRTQQFKIYDVADGAVQSADIIAAGGNGHGSLAGFLRERGVDTLICGGIGGGAQDALSRAGIRLYGGANGEADRAVEDLLANRLQYNPDVRCGHHGEGHTCGGHHEHG